MKWLLKAVVLAMLLAWGPGAPVMAEEEPGAKPAALNFEYQGLWPSEQIQAEQEAAGKFADNSSLDAPTRAAALNERALCWYFLGEHEKARAALDEAIKLDSKKAAYYVNRAIMLRRLGENEKATVRPSDHFNRKEITLSGSCCFPLGEYGEILRLFERGLRAKDMITHRFTVDQAAEAYAAFAAGNTGKVVFVPRKA
jgi:threonine dehydrogenase-like Zn-dependent dehydrogenase